MKDLPRISLLLALLLAPLTGCQIFKGKKSLPEQTLSRFFPSGQSNQPQPGELQQSLLQFSNTYSLQLIQSMKDIEAAKNSPFTPEKALTFKISSISTVISIATGENPNVNLLNLVGLSTLSRMALENYWVQQPDGALFEPWLQSAKTLESKIWSIADTVLSKDQQDELRKSIQTYYASMKDHNNLLGSHPQEMMITKSLQSQTDEKSLFSLAAINPFSGLDPTVAEISQMRLFAERGLYTMQWMPWLLRWQSELLVLKTTNQPEVAQTLEDITNLSASIDRASKAAESISVTAAALPGQITKERAAIVEAMNTQEGQLTTLFQAGNEMSVSANAAIESLDALMKRFGVGEPHAPRDPNKKPFDILDYAKTADAFTATAVQLNTALAELNTTLDSTALDKVSAQATADARSVLNHLFLLAGGLTLLILVCALVYRKTAKPKEK
jgi:hypothetical protein